MAFRTGLGAQLGLAAETTWGTYVAPTRFLEFVDENLNNQIGRIESKGLRSNKRVLRTDQWKAGRQSAGGDINLEVGNKGFGLLFKAMLGQIATTTPGTLTKKHSASLADPFGQSYTLQVGRPDTGGTVDPFNYLGAKMTAWELANALDGFLMLKTTWDAAQEETSDTLAAASSPAETELLAWTGGSITIGGVELGLQACSFTGDLGLKTDRHYIRSGAVTKKEQLAAALVQLGGMLDADFEGLTAYNRFVNGTTATVVGTWTGSQIETGQNFKVVVTVQNARFDGDTPNVRDTGIVDQRLPFVALDDGTNPPILIDYYTTDAAP